MGDSVVRGLALFLRLVIVLFPLVAGLLLLGLGADRLNQAYLQEGEWTAPNGVLAFSSMQARVSWAHLGLQRVSVKNGTAEAWLDYDLFLEPGSVPGEHVGGFQVPFIVKSVSFNVTISAGHGDHQTAALLDQRTILVEDPSKLSIVYGQFAVPAGTVSCHLFLYYAWEGLFVREGFSSYALIVPFANAIETVHNKVYECCPNAVAFLDNVPFMVEVGIPYDCKFEGSFPAPDTQEITTGKPQGNLVWHFNNTGTEWGMPSSNQFRVDFEVPSDAELRNRLFFDSGLYLGLGISLVFSGVYEGLKSVEELTRRSKDRIEQGQKEGAR